MSCSPPIEPWLRPSLLALRTPEEKAAGTENEEPEGPEGEDGSEDCGCK